MSILARKLKLDGEFGGYVVGLWVGEHGITISVTDDEDGEGDACGFDASHVPLDDMLVICRKVRRLAKWAETPKGRAKIEALFDKEVAVMADLQERSTKHRAAKATPTGGEAKP